MISVSDSFEHVEGSALFGEDGIGGLGPHEGFGLGIVLIEVVMDRVLEVGHAGEGAAPDAPGGDLGEDALDEVEPGCTGRREVQLDARVLGEPRLHLGRLVRSVVVEHEMDVRLSHR